MPLPQIAIGMPVFNGGRFIRHAINSLRSQTLEDFVVLISDNASTDDTVEICLDLIGNDSRFKLIQQGANIGAVPNFNWVARNTSSKYFKWAAADDVLAPNYLQACCQALDNNPDVGWCHCKSDMIDENGDSWMNQLDESDPLINSSPSAKWWVGHPRNYNDAESRVQRFEGVLLGTTWSVDSYGLIRRSTLNQTRLLEPIYGAEKVLLAELSLYGKYIHLPELMFKQRVHSLASGNISAEKSQRKFIAANKKMLGSTRLLLLRAHLHSISRSDLSATEKISAYTTVASYLLQYRKWRSVVRQMLGGKGVGGGGAELMKRARNHVERENDQDCKH